MKRFCAKPLLILVAQAALFLSAGIANASSLDRFAQFARTCGLLINSKPRLFAAPDGEHWKEYPNEGSIRGANSELSLKALLLSDRQTSVAQIDGFGQDFADSTLYCFQEARLTRIERQFLTAWGWGYSETDSFKDGSVSAHDQNYFDTKTHKVISRPEGSDAVEDAMKPTIYKSPNDLPFAKLM